MIELKRRVFNLVTRTFGHPLDGWTQIVVQTQAQNPKHQRTGKRKQKRKLSFKLMARLSTACLPAPG